MQFGSICLKNSYVNLLAHLCCLSALAVDGNMDQNVQPIEGNAVLTDIHPQMCIPVPRQPLIFPSLGLCLDSEHLATDTSFPHPTTTWKIDLVKLHRRLDCCAEQQYLLWKSILLE